MPMKRLNLSWCYSLWSVVAIPIVFAFHCFIHGYHVLNLNYYPWLCCKVYVIYCFCECWHAELCRANFVGNSVKQSKHPLDTSGNSSEEGDEEWVKICQMHSRYLLKTSSLLEFRFYVCTTILLSFSLSFFLVVNMYI